VEYGPAHNNLGLMHYEQGNLYQAVMAFEQAREYLPDDPAVVYNLGLALESAGRTGEALELYYEANSMDVANPSYLGNLVRLRVRLGERDELLQQQLRDLVLIETRPEWRRWADTQLALTVNDALDRGPAAPDLESTVNQTQNRRSADLRNKIIDLTPVRPTSMQQPIPQDPDFDDLPDEPPPGSFRDETPMGLSAPLPNVIPVPPTKLEENVVEDLTEEGYYRQ
jgi:tetratricopeptide (TPR) repeat protein